jgi:hypothetical protein
MMVEFRANETMTELLAWCQRRNGRKPGADLGSLTQSHSLRGPEARPGVDR